MSIKSAVVVHNFPRQQFETRHKKVLEQCGVEIAAIVPGDGSVSPTILEKVDAVILLVTLISKKEILTWTDLAKSHRLRLVKLDVRSSEWPSLIGNSTELPQVVSVETSQGGKVTTKHLEIMLREFYAELEANQNKIDALEDEVTNHKVDLQKAQADLKATEDLGNIAMRENAAAQETLQEKEAEIERLKGNLQVTLQSLEGEKAQYTALAKDLGIAKAALGNLQGQLEEEQARVAAGVLELTQERKKSAEREDEHANAIKGLQKQSQNLVAEVSELQKQLNKKTYVDEQELTQARASRDAFKSQAATVEKGNKDLQENNRKLGEKVSQQESRIRELETQLRAQAPRPGVHVNDDLTLAIKSYKQLVRMGHMTLTEVVEKLFNNIKD